jgi:hypothetical protein
MASRSGDWGLGISPSSATSAKTFSKTPSQHSAFFSTNFTYPPQYPSGIQGNHRSSLIFQIDYDLSFKLPVWTYNLTTASSDSEWPPAQLGIIPRMMKPSLEIDGLSPFETRILPNSHTANVPMKGPALEKKTPHLIKIWSATSIIENTNLFLALLAITVSGDTSEWAEDSLFRYNSNRIYVRESYGKAATIFLKYAKSHKKRMVQMQLGGTSGVGKLFFARNFIWRLLHPDGVEGTATPDTILCRIGRWYLHHQSRFYFVKNVAEILNTAADANLLECQDAPIICDGAPPPSYNFCNTLVISSPGNLQNDEVRGSKKYGKGCDCIVYLPLWTPEEIETVAGTIYGKDISDVSEISARFQMYGGIPRSIFQYFGSQYDPPAAGIGVTDVLHTLSEVGSHVTI